MIKIEKAESVDTEQIVKLLKITWHSTYKSIMPENIIEKLTSNWHNPENIKKQIENKSIIFNIAKENEKIIGILTLQIKFDCAYLSRLYILNEYHGRGIGKLLMESFPKNNISKIILEVEAENHNARNFYKKNGFIETDEKITDIYGFQLKTIIMEKNYKTLENK